jgi:hypothetical protein
MRNIQTIIISVMLTMTVYKRLLWVSMVLEGVEEEGEEDEMVEEEVELQEEEDGEGDVDADVELPERFYKVRTF